MQHLAKLADGRLRLPLSDVLVGTHFGWPKMTKDFYNIELLLGSFELCAQCAYTRVTGHFRAAHFGYQMRLLPAIEQLEADALPGTTQLLRRGLRTPAFGRQALRLGLERIIVFAPVIRDVLLFFAVITQEIYVLLLSGLARPHKEVKLKPVKSKSLASSLIRK